MNSFEYAIRRHVQDLEAERKKRELNPAEERFLRITEAVAQQKHEPAPPPRRSA